MTSEPKTPRPNAVAAVLGFALLSTLVALRLPWEEPASAVTWLRPSPDLALLLGLGLLVTLRVGPRALTMHAIALGLVASVFFRFAATAMPAFYYRPLALYYDAPFMKGLVHLLVHEYEPGVQKLLIGAGVLVLLLLYAALFFVVRSVVRLGSERRVTLGFVGACLVLACLGAFAPVWSESRLLGLAQCLSRVPRDMRMHELYVAGLADYEREAAERNAELGKVEDVDVYVLFIESYGRVLLDKPAIAQEFRGWAKPWEAQLAQAGFQAKSVYAKPPGKGGGSSWGHMQMLAGIPVGNVRNFELVLQSELAPLPGVLSANGHRSLMVQPMMEVPWPDGQRFYGFDDDIHRSFFSYDGFPYHWGRVPDQYALAQVLEEVIRPSEDPIFLLYVSVSSHAPFKNLPPYLEDWGRVLEPGALAGDPAHEYDIDFLNYKRHPEAERAYVAAMRYSMDTMIGFTCELERPSLVFILGDHQPPSLSGFEGFDESRHVPMHVLANRRDLLKPFVRMADGLVPDAEQPELRTEQFLSLFVQAFGD